MMRPRCPQHVRVRQQPLAASGSVSFPSGLWLLPPLPWGCSHLSLQLLSCPWRLSSFFLFPPDFEGSVLLQCTGGDTEAAVVCPCWDQGQLPVGAPEVVNPQRIFKSDFGFDVCLVCVQAWKVCCFADVLSPCC